MFLGKTGWRIKQFISHRRPHSLEDPDEAIQVTDATDERRPPPRRRRLSWMSQSPSDIPSLQRASSNATVRNSRLPLSNTTAHLSSSSLCSCDCEGNSASIEQSLLSTRPTHPLPEILYLPPLLPPNTTGDARTWRLIFPGPSPPSPTPSILKVNTNVSSTTTIAVGSVLETDEALSTEYDASDDDKTPTQSLRFFESDMGSSSEHVVKLIQNTGEDVGIALSDVQDTIQRAGYDPPSTTSLRSTVAMSHHITRKPQRSPFTPPKSPISCSMSNTKGKNRQAIKKKTTLLDRALRSVPPASESEVTSARWTLTDVTANVVDVFSGKMFRSEAQKSSTLERTIQSKLQGSPEIPPRDSLESAYSDGTDGSTPTEPFHLESFTNRSTPTEETPPASSHLPTPPITPKTQSLSGNKSKQGSKAVAFKGTISTNQPGMTIHDLTFPSPPRTPRRPSSSKSGPLLPTIPESTPFNLTPPCFSQSSSPRLSLQTKQHQDYILLPATNHTQTCPLFTQGPIRIDKPKRRDSEGEPQTPLDWTAFQMAMLGTMDDGWNLYSQDEDGLEDILEWFSSFGFESWGEMETESFPSQNQEEFVVPFRHRYSRRDMGLQRRDSIPDPRNRRRFSFEAMPNEQDVFATTAASSSSASSRSLTYPNPNPFPHSSRSLFRYQSSSQTRTRRERPASLAESLPPSPMLDLVVGEE